MGGINISQKNLWFAFLFLVVVGAIGLWFGLARKKVFSSPIEGLVLPMSSSNITFDTNSNVSWTARFNCELPWQEVYSHFDSILSSQHFSVAPESMQPTNEGYFIRYDSEKTNYSVLFFYWGILPEADLEKVQDKFVSYSLSVFKDE